MNVQTIKRRLNVIARLRLNKPIILQNARFIVAFVAVFIAALGLSYVTWLQQIRLAPKDLALVDNGPDFIISGAKYYHFSDENGNLDFQLDTRELRHFQPLKRTEFDDPSLLMYDEKNKPWSLTAGNGWILHLDENQSSKQPLTFANNVILKSQNSSSMRLETEQLSINPQLKTIQSNTQVTITGPNSVISSRGVLSDFSQQKIEFNNDVEATYQP